MACLASLPIELKGAICSAVADLAPQGESLAAGGKDLASLRLVSLEWAALSSRFFWKTAKLDYRSADDLSSFLGLVVPRHANHIHCATFGKETPGGEASRRVDRALDIIRRLPQLRDVDLELGISKKHKMDDSRLLEEIGREGSQVVKLHLSGYEYAALDALPVSRLLRRLPKLGTLNLRDIGKDKSGDLQAAIRSLEHLKVLQFESCDACSDSLLVDDWQPPLYTLNIYHCNSLTLSSFRALASTFLETLQNIYYVSSHTKLPSPFPPFDLPQLLDLRLELYSSLFPLLRTFDKSPLRVLCLRIVLDPNEKAEVIFGALLLLVQAHRESLRAVRVTVMDSEGEEVDEAHSEELRKWCEAQGVDVKLGFWDAWEDFGTAMEVRSLHG
ncbi:hypothetical protein BCR35DRAFT_352331 [Leucosporidium creatinivorum]|uniref:F-box domain-containing protein n=1 Tax=Leucosporidium creatinivorum TaxID=106004 RepID=A0A1Y2FD35_9BASI|nr:hypothetical protein BCR35DRAFT_352331 [Leucosporidium creatinivorum]